jgi:hypothetical protein
LGDASNDLVTKKTHPLHAAYLDLRKRSVAGKQFHRNDITLELPYLMVGGQWGPDRAGPRLEANNSAAAAQMAGDCTFFYVIDDAGSNAWMSVGYVPASGWRWHPCFNFGGYPTSVNRLSSVKVLVSGKASGASMGTINYFCVRYVDATRTLTVQDRLSAAPASQSNLELADVPQMNVIWLGGTLAGPTFSPMRVHQLLLFNRALSDAEVAALMAWAGAKWPC